VDVEDMSVGWRLAHDGQYGDAELERLLSVVTEQSTVLMVARTWGRWPSGCKTLPPTDCD